jgi:hypothetical protein
LLLIPFLGLCLWGFSQFAGPIGDTIPEGAVSVPATITSITPSTSKRGLNMYVVARSSDGLIGHTSVPYVLAAECKAGDTIKAWRKGINLYILPAPCPIKKH